MPDRTRVDKALTEMQDAFNEYATAAGQVIPPAADPYIRFANFPAFQAKEAALTVESNITDLDWVLFAENDQHSWYGDPQPVPASRVINVKARANADRVKVLSRDRKHSTDSLPFLYSEAPLPTNPTVPPVVGGSADKVAKYLDGLRGGMNLEREIMAEFSQDEHNYVREQVPFDTARAFCPWRPQGGFAFNDGQSWTELSDEKADRFVAGLVRMRRAGYKRALADCADVCEDRDLDDNGARLIAVACDKISKRVANADLPPDFLSIGPINEWACKQETVHRYQDMLMGVLRKNLPNHILIFGCDYWKYWGKLIEGTSYKVPVDDLAFCDTHSYTKMDANGWRWLAGELSKWQQRTKRRVVFGEAGAGAYDAGDDYWRGEWDNNLRVMLPIMRPFVPITWSVNKGSAWRFNWNGAELTNGQSGSPRLADALKAGLGL